MRQSETASPLQTRIEAAKRRREGDGDDDGAADLIVALELELVGEECESQGNANPVISQVRVSCIPRRSSVWQRARLSRNPYLRY